jgi:hypothetical protein
VLALIAIAVFALAARPGSTHAASVTFVGDGSGVPNVVAE